MKREQASTITQQECNTAKINSVSEMLQLAYDLIKSHSQDMSADKEPLCLITCSWYRKELPYQCHS